ncbi:MAG: MotA/TolQ/ExbB proton channel family protein [Ignavibacteriaceae bacterium]|jgi:biopolymer transport protein ExbB|nr:MotA/TolQ/ExbB proton channel family protein [Ignavibacteriaceae bacterium]
MKQSIFIVSLFFVALAIALAIFLLIFGDPSNFKDGAGREVPLNLLGTIYTGGPLVSLLIAMSIMDVAIIVERVLSLKKAAGKKAIPKFFAQVLEDVKAGRIDEGLAACDEQRGSVANILRAALSRYKELSGDTSKKFDAEKALPEVQRSVEEAMMLEVPLLEKNLIALSTIASIATMIGLLGTVIGMIRSFAALANAGSVDATALATGISEALINTAGGLIVAIIGIVSYNFFVNKVDNFTFQVDEASYNVIQILKSK